MPLVERPHKGRRQWAKGSESVAHLRTPSIASKGNGTYLGGKSDRNALFHPRSPHWDDGRAWSFVSGQTAMANGNLEGEINSGAAGERFDFETVETGKSWPLDDRLPLGEGSIDDIITGTLPPQTAQALRSLAFLKQHLAIPFNIARHTPTPIDAVHKRHHAIVSVCKEWIRSVNGAEITGMKMLVGPLHRFFQSGQVLMWVEIMAAAQQLHKLVEIVKDLRAWLGRAKTVGQSPELEKKMEVIKLWTIDLEFIMAEYAPCLHTFPNEIYFISPMFLPQNSLLRQQLSVLASQRHEPLPAEFISRTEREPYKFVRFPRSVMSDPSFTSEDVTRFTLSPKGSLVAFRGVHQVIIFSSYTSAIFCTFHFPRREPAFVAFSPGSTMLAVSFSTTESRLLDLRTGRIIQEVRDHKITSKNEMKRSKSISLGKDAKKLHTQHKSHDVGSETEQLNFAATYLEERTSAVGPEGVHALLTTDGVFKVSDESGNTLFFRRIMLEEGSRKTSLQRSLTALKRTWSGPSSGPVKSDDKRLKPVSGSNTPKRLSFTGAKNDVFVSYKCYDIGTHEAEDSVFDKFLSQYGRFESKSLEPVLNISFNATGTVALLHTTSAFGANLDLLHVANYSAKENPSLHLVYPTPPQPIRAFSASSDGDLLALSPQNLTTVTILRISQRQAIYNLDTSQIGLTHLLGLSFVPGGRNALMTAHAGGHAAFWDLTRLTEEPHSVNLLAPQISLRDDGHNINANGKLILLNRVTNKGCTPLIFRTEETTFSAIATSILFSRSTRCPHAISLSDDGHFLTIGKYLYSLGTKNKRKKISLPDKSHVVTSTISPNSKLALAVLLPTLQSQVRVLNWSSSRTGDWIAPAEVLNIWGLTFSKDEERLAVGVQLRSVGLDKFAVCVLAKVSKGLQEISRTLEWESMKPVQMSFTRTGKLVVLVADRDRDLVSWSTLTFKMPSETAIEMPVIIDFTPHERVLPAMTSEGDVYYLGAGFEEGWVMRLAVDKEDGEKAVWCPSSWWSIGSLSILSARKGKAATLVFVNTVMGIAAVKLQLAD